MANFSGVTLTMQTQNQSQKAIELDGIVKQVVSKIGEIDAEILRLVQGGIEGTAVETMAKTYINNRDVINEYVKTFESIACVLEENAVGMDTLNAHSEEAAGIR